MTTTTVSARRFRTPALPSPQPVAACLPMEQHCEIVIVPDRDLSFTVRVTLGRKRFIKGGFANPDEAQRCGVRVMCAMHAH